MRTLQRYTEVLSQVNIALNQQIESIKSSIFPNTAVGGSPLEYHWFIERGEAGPVLSIKWVPSTVLKTKGS